MKKLEISLALILSVLLAVFLTACGGTNEPPKDTTPESSTLQETDPVTEAPTAAPTEPATEAPTDPVTEAPTETIADEVTETESEEDTTPLDPYTTPVPVGTSYDGKTTCYDGRFEHEWETFKTIYGEFYSIQDAVDSLEGEGGNISLTTNGDVGLCLSVVIPNDDCFYRIFYNYNNCDFVFNFGYTFDDGSYGYAYYSSLDRLDSISGLDGNHVYCWGANDELEQGYYLMTEKQGEVAEGERHYLYELVCPVEEVWEGLPWGETYFEE